MTENHIYEMTENECYPTLTKQQGNAATSTMATTAGSTSGPSQSMWFRVIVVLAIFINFLLIIGVGAALFYYQTKMAFDINQGLTNGLSNRNTSGPPGPQVEFTAPFKLI